MNKTTKIIGGIIIILIIVLLVIFYKPSPKETIKIGFIAPLTGNAASYGEPVKNAVVLAVEEINNSGGIKGKEIKMIYEDGKCEGKEATNAAQKLINIDKVKIILGGFCSGETLAVAPIAEAAKVILFSSGSGNPDITDAGDYIFRNFPSDASSGKKIAEMAIEKNLKKVALLVETTDYAQAVKKVFIDRFSELGGTIVIDESFTSQTVDLKTQLTRIKSKNPDAIYLLPQMPSIAEISFKQIRELGLDMQVLSNEITSSEIILENIADIVEGVLFAEPYFDENDSLTKEFLDKYKERYGMLGGGLPPVYLATSYDAMYILKEQIEKYGENVEKIKKGLYSIKDRKGVAGNLTIDENGDSIFEFVVKVIRNGKVVDYK